MADIMGVTPAAPAQELETSHTDASGVPVAATIKDQQTQQEAASPTATKPTTSALPLEAPTTKKIDLGLPLSAADGLIQKPFASPLETAHPPPPAKLTSDEQSKYESVLNTVSSWTTLPTTSAKNSTTAPLTDDERMFLTRECLLRYLRATKWNVSEAVERLQRTLTWRREYGFEKLTPDHISIENETGKQVILGYDIQGRPCLYLIPSNQNTEKSDRQIQHLVFMLERVIDLMGPDQETLALIVNFDDTKSGQNATVGQAKQTLHILQNHYPERLGRALVIHCKLVPFFQIPDALEVY